MTPGQDCSTCKAFSALTSECRRKSPKAVMIPVGGAQVQIRGIYPATAKDGWCCEWESAETEKPVMSTKWVTS